MRGGDCKQHGTNMTSPLQVVEEFNRDYPVGTRVIVVRDNGDETETSVAAPATIMAVGAPVAWFADIIGAYSISGRVRRAEPTDTN